VSVPRSNTAAKMSRKGVHAPQRRSISQPATVVSIVTVDFEPVGDDRTLMVIEHSLLPPDVVDEHQTGWARTFDQPAAVLTSW
jgi:Activator of Hsp90 ATPase homolog 1-like protein